MNIQKPMSIKHDYWIYESNGSIPSVKTGKWMMFFNEQTINQKWKIAVELFRMKRLPGIVSIKCATALKNPRASSDIKVIIFYCNKSNETERIMKIGYNLVNKLDYQKNLFYKTDMQTLNGTRATGSKKNYLYKIEYKFNAFEEDSD